MSDEPFALSTIPAALPAEGDFDAIHSAVRATVRGRWFLEEYAKRNRNTDTAQVVAAIERIEAVIRGDHAQQVSQTTRIELLEMARAIAQTRAEVAETFKPGDVHSGADAAAAAPLPDVVGAARRLREIAITMRERSIEPSTGEQIEALTAAILAASSLRDPGDQRAQKLSEVLLYLEHRIDRMLDSAPHSSSIDERESAPVPDAPGPAPAETAAALAQDIQVEPPVAEVAPETPAELPVAAAEHSEDPAPHDRLGDISFSAEPSAPDAEAVPVHHIAVEEPERTELDIEPLVVVPAGAAMTSDDTVDESADAQPAADPSLIWAVESPPPTSDDTIDEDAEVPSAPDPSLMWAVDPPAVLVEPPATPESGEIELDPLIVTPPPEAVAEAEAVEPDTAVLTAVTVVEIDDVVPVPVPPAPPADAPPPEPEIEPAVAIESQIESDLASLGELTAGPAVEIAAAIAPPLESDVLSHAWESAIVPKDATAASETPERSVERLPTMWDKSLTDTDAAAVAAEEAPADFLLEPLTEVVAQERRAPAHVESRTLAEIEDELFAGEDEPFPDAVPAAMPAAPQHTTAPSPSALAATPVVAAAAATIVAPKMAPAAAARAAPKPMPRHTSGDPLAALKAMTDEERIALFT